MLSVAAQDHARMRQMELEELRSRMSSAGHGLALGHLGVAQAFLPSDLARDLSMAVEAARGAAEAVREVEIPSAGPTIPPELLQGLDNSLSRAHRTSGRARGSRRGCGDGTEALSNRRTQSAAPTLDPSERGSTSCRVAPGDRHARQVHRRDGHYPDQPKAADLWAANAREKLQELMRQETARLSISTLPVAHHFSTRVGQPEYGFRLQSTARGGHPAPSNQRRGVSSARPRFVFCRP